MFRHFFGIRKFPLCQQQRRTNYKVLTPLSSFTFSLCTVLPYRFFFHWDWQHRRFRSAILHSKSFIQLIPILVEYYNICWLLFVSFALFLSVWHGFFFSTAMSFRVQIHCHGDMLKIFHKSTCVIGFFFLLLAWIVLLLIKKHCHHMNKQLRHTGECAFFASLFTFSKHWHKHAVAFDLWNMRNALKHFFAHPSKLIWVMSSQIHCYSNHIFEHWIENFPVIWNSNYLLIFKKRNRNEWALNFDFSRIV